MTALTPGQLRWIGYALFLVSLLPVVLAVHQFLKSRRAPYYIMRQNARRRSGRWALLALTLQALAIASLIAAIRVPTVARAPTPTSTPILTAPPTLTPSPRPTRTPTPSAMLRASVTPTRRPTATPPPIPTPTPAVPLPEAALTPLPSAVPAREDARIVLVALAIEKDENSRPVEPGNEFPPGDHWVYLFFTYEGMENGVVRTFAWYREGEFIEFCSDTGLWEWGQRGATWYGCRLPGGWEPGRYEIHVFIETLLQGIAQFVIMEE